VQPAWKNGYFHLIAVETGQGGGKCPRLLISGRKNVRGEYVQGRNVRLPFGVL